MVLLNLFSQNANRNRGFLTFKDFTTSIGHYAQECQRDCHPSTLSHRFYSAVANLFRNYTNEPADPKSYALETVALRAIRMSGRPPSLPQIVSYVNNDDHLNNIMAHAGATDKDLEIFIRKNLEQLVKNKYLARGSLKEVRPELS